MFDFYGEYKFFWMLVVVSLPLFSIWAYFFFGNLKKLKLYDFKKKPLLSEKTRKLIEQYQIDNLLKNTKTPLQIQNLFRYVEAITGFNSWANVDFTLFTAPFNKFKQMRDDLSNAKKYIYINYFIIQPSDCFDFIYEILLKKLKEKVEIKIIYDFAGKLFNSIPSELKELKQKGASVKAFGNLFPFDINMIYVDHRKDLVIDGKIAYTGGYNIGDEYCHMSASYGYWQDTHLRLVGGAAKQIEFAFCKEWKDEFADIDFKKYLYKNYQKVKKINSITHVITCLKPQKNSIMRNLILETFNIAQKKIWIMTPFLVIDEEMTQNLIRQAMKKIDVRIILTKNSKKWFVHIMRLRFQKLIEAGIKIYEFHGYSHSKIILIDDSIILAGTTNLDYYSLYWSKQTMLLIYDKNLAQEIEEKVFIRDFQFADLLKESPIKKRHLFYRWKAKLTSIIRLFL